MHKRLTKQILIIFIIIIVFLLLLLLAYLAFFKIEPSCFDGVQNQNEEKIDCGGVCASCEDIYPEEINILKTDYILMGSYYNVSVRIENKNQNYGSDHIPYKIQLHDNNGKIIGERSGTTFIFPKQTKHIIELKIPVSGIVGDIDLSFGNINWLKPDKDLPQLFILQKEYVPLSSDQSGYAQIKGIVLNRSKLGFSKVYIDVLLYSNDELIGINTTEINDLASNQERGFSVIWFEKIDSTITSIEIKAETDIFDVSNIIR